MTVSGPNYVLNMWFLTASVSKSPDLYSLKVERWFWNASCLKVPLLPTTVSLAGMSMWMKRDRKAMELSLHCCHPGLPSLGRVAAVAGCACVAGSRSVHCEMLASILASTHQIAEAPLPQLWHPKRSSSSLTPHPRMVWRKGSLAELRSRALGGPSEKPRPGETLPLFLNVFWKQGAGFRLGWV